ADEKRKRADAGHERERAAERTGEHVGNEMRPGIAARLKREHEDGDDRRNRDQRDEKRRHRPREPAARASPRDAAAHRIWTRRAQLRSVGRSPRAPSNGAASAATASGDRNWSASCSASAKALAASITGSTRLDPVSASAQARMAGQRWCCEAAISEI